ncbi:MAG: cobalamin B12-binding domain-containing protein [Deltaproteobacteria bacterium]|nr:cobalamin B12-binding domain-containing protein [Deltaproteobacteria bacterium]
MKKTIGRKLLLSSVCRPFGPEHGDGFGVSYEGTHQIMWAQGAFRTRATTTQWGIDFIAENLNIPTTTLHYPTMRQFVAEVKKGYDYVGIAFVSPTLHKMIPMVQAVREVAPKTKIILGGYGTALGDEIAPYADYVCRGEGVEFMRRLLGERTDVPIRQPLITQQSTLFSLPVLNRTGYVIAGLGCPNGCDFCATSHYFGKKHVRLLPDGPAILEAIERLRREIPGLDSIWINDEDFLLDESRGRGFLEAIRRSDLPPLSISVFGSVKGLSQYTADELVEMGIDWIWVGFEGRRAGFSKMQGRSYRDLFADLHAHGISVLASMIIGFDYQTPEIIREEYEELLSLRPSMCQFLIYGPAHGTPLYARLAAEGRIDPEVMNNHSLHDGFSLGFRHPHIGRDEMSAIQRGLYREEFARLGPSVFRVVDDWLAGYSSLRGHAVERVRAKAERYGRQAHRAMALLPGGRRHVNAATAAWLRGLQDRIAAATGPMTASERVSSLVVSAAIRYTQFKLRHDIGQQPQFTRRSYRMDPAKQGQLAPLPRIAFNPGG